jgi:hypothetical protein
MDIFSMNGDSLDLVIPITLDVIFFFSQIRIRMSEPLNYYHIFLVGKIITLLFLDGDFVGPRFFME